MKKTIEEINSQEIKFIQTTSNTVYKVGEQKELPDLQDCIVKPMGDNCYYIESYFAYGEKKGRDDNGNLINNHKFILHSSQIKVVVFK